jgi:hypothetical protein
MTSLRGREIPATPREHFDFFDTALGLLCASRKQIHINNMSKQQQ